MKKHSHHAGDELVDEVFTVSENTTVGVWVSLLFETLVGAVELEGPEEVVNSLEVGSASLDFVDNIFDAVNSEFTESSLNNDVIGEGDSASVEFTVSSLVDELLDDGAGGVTVGDEGFNHADHVDGGLVETDEDTVVELSQTEELHDLLGLGGELVDTIK